MIKNIGFGITGSFCTHEKIIFEIEKLVKDGFNVVPIITNSVKETNTRFGNSKDFILKLEQITGNKVVSDIVGAEPIGPKNLIDIMVVAPCTGNTISKLANAITDNAVTMVCKSHMRNNKPVVVGISTNDALGFNAINIGKLISMKNIYFVPFGQDDAINKPKSLISEWSLLKETIINASKGIQIQPMLIKRGDL